MGKTPVPSRTRPRARTPRRRGSSVSRPGACRWCRCTYLNPCPESCGWANREQTLCTACVNVDREWKHLKAAQVPTMRRAFFLGFMAGADDERALGDEHTYRVGGQAARYWNLGHVAGARQVR